MKTTTTNLKMGVMSFSNHHIFKLSRWLLFIAICTFANLHVNAQGTWTQKNNFGGTARWQAAGFSIGTKGYIGTGRNGATYYNDFWEWDQTTDVWTQKANFGGTARADAVGFSIGTKGYIGTGDDAVGFKQDFWEWDQATNVWTAKANFGGTARNYAVGFSIGTKGYIGTGTDAGSYKQDFWEWDQATNVWTAKTNFPGTGRQGAVGFSIGTKGYIGTGYNAGTLYKDFYEWDQTTNVWTAKTNFGGTARYAATSFSIGTKGYIGTGWDGVVKQDCYEWDQATNVWTQKTDLCSARCYDVSFSIGTKGYIGTGTPNGGIFYQDFYEFDPAGTGTSCQPLPIELLYFNAIAENNTRARCEWTTATEINNDYFAVERSKEGTTFEQIGTVKGAGNSSTALNYVFYDHEPYSGVSYYRLKQFDYNGAFTYSPIRSVYIGVLDIISIYPNPSASGYIQYTVASSAGGDVSVNIYDVRGRKVLDNTETLEGGVTTKKLSTAVLSSGNYLLQITNGNLEKTQKQFVIK